MAPRARQGGRRRQSSPEALRAMSAEIRKRKAEIAPSK
jgi:hypothetical protein